MIKVIPLLFLLLGCASLPTKKPLIEGELVPGKIIYIPVAKEKSSK